MAKVVAFFTIAFISVPFVYCVRQRLVPERANMTEMNEDYLENVKLYVSRTNRKSPYYINLQGRIKYLLGNNVSANAYFFEYLHNEYRRTFVEMHSPLCDFMNNDILIGKMFKAAGATCPILAGEYYYLNMTLPMQNFPFKIPFSKFRAEFDWKITNTNVFIAKSYLTGVIKNY